MSRSVLAGAGALLGGLGGLTLGTRQVSASTDSDRHVVDLADASDGALDGLDVVHHIEEIDAAVVRGSDADVQGLRSSRDVRFQIDTPARRTSPR